ncbi:double-strand break repair helicase AddA [Altericroceibacterium spongiae]|uniref:DNA 3'-5' helicase n=1 Tax=Altericroceibacterium spongiae TaxID=2320269 RepID=A0A420EF95_9SPHN|nr:double-strand break repair helicase AddA [Altericroceibacterium spongiae]RKF19343.1 double-strand break repair helicase AddA [Altericroceibacterium spongiae]
MSGAVYPLHGAQKLAVNPADSVWLSASAGTGKTQVLSARVLRLLMQSDVTPAQILCLTFTKAGAAEMAVRINEVLARWVRLPETELATELGYIGAPSGPEARAHARTLFASVLDCPGGGLRIDTIHAFSQWLLSAFPEEAELTPGTQAMEDRDRELLAREVLSEMLLDAERQGDNTTLSQLAMLSLRLGPDAVQGWLMRCAQAREAWFGPGAWAPPLMPRVKRLLGLEEEADEAMLAALCADEDFAIASLRDCARANAEWGTKTGLASADAIAGWLAASPQARVERLDDLEKALFTQKGEPRSLKSLLKIEPAYEGLAGQVKQSLDTVRQVQLLLSLAEWLAPALTVGRQFALAWDEAKKREGLIDFDDQIRRAAQLLSRSDLSDWIRYKLDRRFDHILIDEAQDTNEAQWDIVRALTGDFFTGLGQHADKLRTIFVVGDYKQAIFGFQGTSPDNFEAARARFQKEISESARNARRLNRAGEGLRDLQELGLDRSFRTAQPVLDFVDAAIERITPERFGLTGGADRHVGEDRPGLVALWPPVSAHSEEGTSGDEGEEGWLSKPDRMMADRIAAQVARWMEEGFPLVKGGARRAGPGDVMVLVRKRRDLAGLIVARLHARGVPVAGVDRLRLGAPLAVQDLMAAIRFAAQPLDDLNLAALLVSPLVGWTQQELLDHGWRESGRRLWDHLRASTDPHVRATLAKLTDLLRLADFEPPQGLLSWILTGPWRGRQALVRRLGHEANDPIDELLNAAHAYSSAHAVSLQGFIRWFDAGDGELKREAGAGEGLVRVMTVHGSKGLQAPIVILADAAGNPNDARGSALQLEERLGEGDWFDRRTLPLPSIRKDDRAGPVAEAAESMSAAELEEHWRLLYVAMTRAEEALFIGGALGLRETEPHKDSWYAQLAPLFPSEAVSDPVWGERHEWGAPGDLPDARRQPPAAATQTVDLPGWAVQPIGPEPRPPRPLAPSSAGEDQAADPPLPADQAGLAARRGILIHKLLERLPELSAEERAEAGRIWLARQAGDVPEDARQDMLDAALRVLAEPQWAELFSPAALAEIRLAATVEGQVIAGIADRLLVEEDRVLIADFKTARRPPRSLDGVPQATLRQMGAYAAALQAIYPGRRIEAAVLYTQTPQLIAIPGDILARHKPGLSGAQESLGL